MKHTYKRSEGLGRDGKDSQAVLFYRPCDISHASDQDFILFIKNKNGLCRRNILLSCFQESISPLETPHLCCDICEKLCKCLVCKDKPSDEETESPKVRVASEKEINAVKECLVELDLKQFSGVIVSNIDHINSLEDIENLGIPDPFSLYVMEMFNEVFTGASSQ